MYFTSFNSESNHVIVLLIGSVFFFFVLQLVETENVRGVITMNEMYETKYFCNSAEVSSRHLYFNSRGEDS